MNKKYKLSALWILCLMVFSCLSFTACNNGDDEDTNQYIGGISLNVFGPSPVARGGELRFLGSGMDKITAVAIPGCDEITDIKVISNTEVRVTVPQSATTGFVVLKTPTGEITTKTKLTFTEPIALDAMTPLAVKPGDELTLTGEYLNLIKEVIFNDNVVVTEFVSKSRKEIKVIVPIEARSGKVIISDGAEIPNWIYSKDELTVAIPTYAASSAVKIKAGETLVIEGDNLNWVSSVNFDGAKVTEFTITEDAKTLTVIVPDRAKSGAITLGCYSGVEVEAGDINLVAPTELAVVSGAVKNGTDLNITGKDLDLVVSVVFPNVTDAVELKGEVSATKITVTVPGLAQDGDIILNMANGETVSVAYKTLKPTITVFTPVAPTAGDNITITGTDLDLVGKIVFAGEDSPTIIIENGNYVNETTLKITLPSVAETCEPTLVLKNGMEVKTTVTLNITPSTSPAVASITPNAVILGNQFTVLGKNLNNVETFYVGGVKVTSFGDHTDTKVVMTVPKTAHTGVTAIKMKDYTGNEFTSNVTMEILPVEITIWEGSVSFGNWANGHQGLAWGGYDWATVSVGQTLHFYFDEDSSGSFWQLKLGRGSDWATLPDFKIFAGGADAVDIEAGATSYSYSLGADDLKVLQDNNGLILQGAYLIVKKITIDAK